MNLKTTLALILLAACGALAWYGSGTLPYLSKPDGTAAAPEEVSVKPDGVTKIVIQRAKDTVTLERSGNDWRLAGGWAARPAEVRRLLDALANLESRFTPEESGEFKPAVTVVVTTKEGTRTFGFGEKAAQDGTRFDRPTYVRVGEGDTVSRLAPGLVALFDRPADYFQQRRLFPSKREKKDDTGTARVERLDGKELAVEEKGEKRFAVRKAGDTWELSYPYRDALDPRARDQLLEAVADLWAEKFLDKAPEKFEVEKRLTLTRNDGTTMTLEIGPPLTGMDEKDRAHARLAGNNRVFEINTSRFGDVFPARLETLRDGQLARFTAADAREVKLVTSAGTVELKNRAARKPGGDGPPPPSDWRLGDVKADAAAVDKLLSSLSGLSSVERDAGMKADVGAAVGALSGTTLATPFFAAPDLAKRLLGVDPPAARIEVVVEEGPLNAPKRKTLTVALGRHDKDTKKLFATSGDYPRVNEIADDLAEQVLGKKALDFRGKKVLELASADVKKVRIESRTLPPPGPGVIGTSPLAVAAKAGGPTALTLERTSDGWNITEPVKTTADAGKCDDLAGKLAGLEAVAFVAELGKAPDAASVLLYGFDQPMVKAMFADKVLLVGKPRGDGPGWYARLQSAPQVFTLANETVEMLRRDSLGYRPSQLWALAAGDEVTEFAFTREGQAPFKIIRKGEGWEVTGPFTVAAPKEVADALVKALTAPRAEGYRAHEAKDLTPFGLAKPAVIVTLKTKSGKEQTLSLGKDAEPGRFAILGKGPAVAVVGDEVARAADRSALDFLDKGLLTFDSAAVTGLTRTMGADTLELVKKDDAWAMTRPSAQAADERKVPELLKLLGSLKAERLVAYAPTDVKPFGLDRPVATISLEPDKQQIMVGAELPGTGERHIQVRGNPAIGVITAQTAARLLASPLTFRDHLLVRVPDADTMTLEAGERKVTFGKPEGTWKVTKPLSAEADHDAMEAFLNSLSRLRADEFVAEKPALAHLAKYGLDKPAARWTLDLDGKKVLDLTVGGTEPAGARRYARLAGSEVVFLLEPKVSAQAVTEYRPRVVVRDVDPAQIEEVKFGHREGAFTIKKMGTNWEVDGKSDVKLDTMAVSDALAALRDLKLERYVMDDGAQLKLFGLDPPDLVLEVTTPTGKKVLYLGGQEGGMKRRYARIPTSKARDVFLLDESASTKLFRKLADLTVK